MPAEEQGAGGDPKVLAQVIAAYQAQTTSRASSSSKRPKNASTKKVTTIKKASAKRIFASPAKKNAIQPHTRNVSPNGHAYPSSGDAWSDFARYVKSHGKAVVKDFIHEEPVSEIVGGAKWSAKHPGDTAAISAALSLVIPGVGGDVLEFASALASLAATGEDLKHGHYQAAEYDLLGVGGFGIAKAADFLEATRLAPISKALARAEESGAPYSRAIRSDIELTRSSLKVATTTLAGFKKTGDVFSTFSSINALLAQAAASRKR